MYRLYDISSIRKLLPFLISLFLILMALKTKLYLRFRSYIYSDGIFFDLPSILFYDLLFAIIFTFLAYLLIRIFKRGGIYIVKGIYSFIIVFSALSTITYLRLGAPINAGMIGDIEYEFLKSSIEQTTDIKLLLTKLILILIISVFLPSFLKRVFSKVFQKHVFLISLTLILLSLLFPIYLKANRLAEPDLWKTPVQSFINPFLSEYHFKLNDDRGDHKFSFKSPFTSKKPPTSNFDLPIRNYNVVIYLMEGVPLKLINELVDLGYMPNVQKMLSQSISFNHYYPTAGDSTKGIFSILTSMYPFPGKKKITNVTNQLKCKSLPRILAENKYSTTIAHSGSFNWDHTKYFFRNNFQTVIDQSNNKASNTYNEFSWGLDDQFLIDQLDRVLTSKEGPHFIILVPSNTHHPYLTSDVNYEIFPKVNYANKLKNAICYQDQIIGKLNQLLVAHKIADNTITILTSDHSVRFDYDKGQKEGRPEISPSEEQSAIPFIIHNQQIRKKLSSNIISSHLDIAPTILEMIGLQSEKQFQGISLLQRNIPQRIHFIVNNVRNFNIILRDTGFQYFYDISNNREAIRYKNLSSSGGEYLADEFPDRSNVYKQLCIEFIKFQKEYLKNTMGSS
jgi:phosphoglycerol transferase MdoB-like AlkP superfamily enzyme